MGLFGKGKKNTHDEFVRQIVDAGKKGVNNHHLDKNAALRFIESQCLPYANEILEKGSRGENTENEENLFQANLKRLEEGNVPEI